MAMAMSTITIPTPSSSSSPLILKPRSIQTSLSPFPTTILKNLNRNHTANNNGIAISSNINKHKHPSLFIPKSLPSSSSLIQPQIQLPLKSRLQNGDTLYGMFLCSFCPTLAEIAGLAGYDFVLIDMEHGFGGIPEALSCIRALAATNTPAILRLPETTAVWAKKAMDLGPQGIMFPMIESPIQAQNAVSFCRYPPHGVRGAAHPIVRASGYGIHSDYLTTCEDDFLIMCQVETADALERVDEIAAVDGVDCIQMGPTDLSASMGYLWDPGNNKVMQALNTAEKTVLMSKGKEGKGAYLCGFAMQHDSPEQMKGRGYHMVSGAVDIGLFRNAAVHDVNKFHLSLQEEDDAMGGANDNDDDDDAKYWSE